MSKGCQHKLMAHDGLHPVRVGHLARREPILPHRRLGVIAIRFVVVIISVQRNQQQCLGSYLLPVVRAQRLVHVVQVVGQVATVGAVSGLCISMCGKIYKIL